MNLELELKSARSFEVKLMLDEVLQMRNNTELGQESSKTGGGWWAACDRMTNYLKKRLRDLQ